MIRVAISGACGRMGAGLVKAVSEAEDMALAAALERPDHRKIGEDVGTAIGGAALGCLLSAEFEVNADVLIDFSSPDGSVTRAEECARAGIPIVIGTTGLDATQMGKVKACAEKIPCLVASNMSIGVNVLFELAEETARRLGEGYDVEIVEAHHRFKKDAPSGTALTLLRRVADALDRDADACASHGRKGATGPRKPGEIGVHSIRAGDIVGEHTVIFSTLGERLELTHRAHSREGFVRGALQAARFIVGKAAGLYGMEDVLKE